MGDDIRLPDRNGGRTPKQMDYGQKGGFSSTGANQLYSPVISDPMYSPKAVNVVDQAENPASVYNVLHRMILIRKTSPALDRGEFEWFEDRMIESNRRVAAYWRTSDEQRILVLNNLTAGNQDFAFQLPDGGIYQLSNLLDPVENWVIQDGIISGELTPYQYRWLLVTPVATSPLAAESFAPS
jgi:maltose alpha-D-glucosyltransferase/alpha-amylase